MRPTRIDRVWFTRGMRLPAGLVVRALAGMVVGSVAARRSWDVSGLDDRQVVVLLALSITVMVSVAMPGLQEHLVRPGSVPALIGVMQFAIYCCVPETDQIPQVAFAVVVLLTIEVAADRPLPWWLVVPVLGWVLWSGLSGATGRDSALVGTLFAAWPLLVVLAGVGSPLVAGAVGSIAAVAVARTGALQSTGRPALVAVAIAGTTSLVLIGLVGAMSRSHAAV